MCTDLSLDKFFFFLLFKKPLDYYNQMCVCAYNKKDDIWCKKINRKYKSREIKKEKIIKYIYTRQ